MAEEGTKEENREEGGDLNAPLSPFARASELAFIMGAFMLAYFVWNDESDLPLQFSLLGLIVVLSIVGGFVTNAKRSAPAGET